LLYSLECDLAGYITLTLYFRSPARKNTVPSGEISYHITLQLV